MMGILVKINIVVYNHTKDNNHVFMDSQNSTNVPS